MNKKTLEHIERFINSVEWNFVINDNTLTFDVKITCPKHLPHAKKLDLWEEIQKWIRRLIPTYIEPIYEILRGGILTEESCHAAKSIMRRIDDERRSRAEPTIKEMLRDQLLKDNVCKYLVKINIEY